MSDNDIKEVLKDAHGAVRRPEAPAFGKVWAAAESQNLTERRRYAAFSGMAAALAMVAIVAGLWSTQETGISDDFLIADSLLNTTQWSAPSDVLMPTHEFDIYREIPFLMESTDPEEGTLL
jgi:hypothetical protein